LNELRVIQEPRSQGDAQGDDGFLGVRGRVVLRCHGSIGDHAKGVFLNGRRSEPRGALLPNVVSPARKAAQEKTEPCDDPALPHEAAVVNFPDTVVKAGAEKTFVG
jgi:hypothetical protein